MSTRPQPHHGVSPHPILLPPRPCVSGLQTLAPETRVQPRTHRMHHAPFTQPRPQASLAVALLPLPGTLSSRPVLSACLLSCLGAEHAVVGRAIAHSPGRVLKLSVRRRTPPWWSYRKINERSQQGRLQHPCLCVHDARV